MGRVDRPKVKSGIKMSFRSVAVTSKVSKSVSIFLVQWSTTIACAGEGMVLLWESFTRSPSWPHFHLCPWNHGAVYFYGVPQDRNFTTEGWIINHCIPRLPLRRLNKSGALANPKVPQDKGYALQCQASDSCIMPLHCFSAIGVIKVPPLSRKMVHNSRPTSAEILHNAGIAQVPDSLQQIWLESSMPQSKRANPFVNFP